ncbi:hypothetical protein C8Q79DRAFT_285508 [Trametes meyenii]|nr:hypothetical protein C8Q79DRAFT_285508 [Trametes meyenii]
MNVPLTTPYFPAYAEASTGDQDALVSLLRGDISAVFGGSFPALKPDEPWPCCKACARPLQPYLQINVSTDHTPGPFRALFSTLEASGHADIETITLLQVFLCTGEGPNFLCFEDCISGAAEGESWLVRCLAIAKDSSSPVSSDQPPRELASIEEMLERTSLQTDSEDTITFPLRVILSWSPGNPEVPHFEEQFGMDFECDDALYDAHEPARGLKLLGNAIWGKVTNVTGPNSGWCAACEAAGTKVWDYRCLVQLGTDDIQVEDFYDFSTSGNTWIVQCKAHPDVLRAAWSFTA